MIQKNIIILKKGFTLALFKHVNQKPQISIVTRIKNKNNLYDLTFIPRYESNARKNDTQFQRNQNKSTLTISIVRATVSAASEVGSGCPRSIATYRLYLAHTSTMNKLINHYSTNLLASTAGAWCVDRVRGAVTTSPGEIPLLQVTRLPQQIYTRMPIIHSLHWLMLLHFCQFLNMKIFRSY